MKIAFVFPGQGSQSIGMMAGFDAYPAIRATFAEASDLLAQDLWALVTAGPEADLNQTVNTQPVMLTAGVAVWRAWQAAGGPSPSVVAGHSLGEYTALVAAGALAFRDALPLVRFRAQAMQDAVPAGVGAMAAILGLDAAAVTAACAEAAGPSGSGEVVEPVNFNAPEQIVIAGHRAAVERAIAVATARGAKRGVLLPVSAPFHSSLLKPAAVRLAAKLVDVASSRRRSPCCTTSTSRKSRRPTGSATRSRGRRRARCAGSRRSRRSPRAASRTSSNAGRDGCLPGSTSGSRASSKSFALDRRRRHRRDQSGADRLTQRRGRHGERDARRTGRAGDRRDARHRPGDRARRSARRGHGRRHRDHRRGCGEDRRRT